VTVSEAPLFDGAGVEVGVVDVALDEGEVALDHVEGFVAEHALQGIDVAAIA